MTVNIKRDKVPHIDVTNYPRVPNSTPLCSTTAHFQDIGIFSLSLKFPLPIDHILTKTKKKKKKKNR